MEKMKLLDSIKDEDCYTIEDISEELNLGIIRTRQIVTQAIKEKLVQNLIKKDGRRILYTPQMFEQLQAQIEKGKLGKIRKKKNQPSLKNAVLVVNVPIFDPEIARLLLIRHKTQEELSKFVKANLEASVKSVLERKRELEKTFEEQVEKLFSDNNMLSM